MINHRSVFCPGKPFQNPKKILTSVYNHILLSFPYGYIVLDFSQNRSEYLRISTRWFTTESVMVFTEQSSKCGGDSLKPFRCYHLIADNVFKLLNSSQTCNNINKNTNSVEINGLEKNVNGYTKYNNSLEQTDVGVLNNPTNENPSDSDDNDFGQFNLAKILEDSQLESMGQCENDLLKSATSQTSEHSHCKKDVELDFFKITHFDLYSHTIGNFGVTKVKNFVFEIVISYL